MQCVLHLVKNEKIIIFLLCISGIKDVHYTASTPKTIKIIAANLGSHHTPEGVTQQKIR